MKHLALLPALLLACAAACAASFEESRPPEAFVRQARAVIGSVDFKLFHVASHGILRDRQYVEALKQGSPPDNVAEQLAQLMRRGSDESLVIVVAGGSSEKTTEVLVEAFSALGPLQLPGLDLVVLCRADHRQEIRLMARLRGVDPRFGELDE